MIKPDSLLTGVNMSKLPGAITDSNLWCGNMNSRSIGLVISSTQVAMPYGVDFYRLELLCLSDGRVGWIDAKEVVLLA